MTTVAAVRHVAFEDLGILEDLFAERGWTVQYIEAPVADWTAVELSAPDLVVVLGGPISANDEADYPFLAPEMAQLKKRLEARKPTLGLCLGAQLIAKALGARVHRAAAKEIGWSPLLLTGAGHTSPCKHLSADQTFMFHWHGETFTLPEDAVLLAGTELCPNQAFILDEAILAFQCHPEVRGPDLEKWFTGHALEISITPGVNVPLLRADTRRYAAVLERQARLCFNAWLDKLKI